MRFRFRSAVQWYLGTGRAQGFGEVSFAYEFDVEFSLLLAQISQSNLRCSVLINCSVYLQLNYGRGAPENSRHLEEIFGFTSSNSRPEFAEDQTLPAP